jgi:hypothetical protein
MTSDRFYISARKEGTEDSWQFVRNCRLSSFLGPGTDPFVHTGNNQLEIYLSRLTELGYETVVTNLDNGRHSGLYIEEPDLADKVENLSDGGWTAELSSPVKK